MVQGPWIRYTFVEGFKLGRESYEISLLGHLNDNVLVLLEGLLGIWTLCVWTNDMVPIKVKVRTLLNFYTDPMFF